MAESTHEESTVRMYGVLFTIIAVVALVGLIYLLSTRSSADDSTQTATTANAVPTLNTPIIGITSGGADQTSVNPIENGLRVIYVQGTVTDNNGCNDIDTAANWDFDLYRTDVASGAGCTLDNNDCYKNRTTNDLAIAGCTGVGDLNATYEWSTPIQYYADATDTGAVNAATNWTVGITAGDESSGVSTVATDTFEFNSLYAFDVTASTNYGALALGADSAEKTVTFTQTGNRDLDADQSASGDMICDGSGSQNIAVAQVHHSSISGFTYAAEAGLSTGAVNFNLTLGRRTNDGAALTKNWYFVLRVPTTGLRGTCTNTVTFTAKADA